MTQGWHQGGEGRGAGGSPLFPVLTHSLDANSNHFPLTITFVWKGCKGRLSVWPLMGTKGGGLLLLLTLSHYLLHFDHVTPQ